MMPMNSQCCCIKQPEPRSVGVVSLSSHQTSKLKRLFHTEAERKVQRESLSVYLIPIPLIDDDDDHLVEVRTRNNRQHADNNCRERA